MASNATTTELIEPIGEGAIWSVLDHIGTQNMLTSVPGDGARLTDYSFV